MNAADDPIEVTGLLPDIRCGVSLVLLDLAEARERELIILNVDRLFLNN